MRNHRIQREMNKNICDSSSVKNKKNVCAVSTVRVQAK